MLSTTVDTKLFSNYNLLSTGSFGAETGAYIASLIFNGRVSVLSSGRIQVVKMYINHHLARNH
jgi:hypothetical protein